MHTLLLYLVTPSGHDGRTSCVRFTPPPGAPAATCHTVRVALPPGLFCLEPAADGGTALVWRHGGVAYPYSPLDVFHLARHGLGGFHIAPPPDAEPERLAVRVCAWCRREADSDGWRAASYGPVLHDVRRTHGICPSCAASVLPA